jgi:exodeoxyribonuclease V alpha subunit
METLEGIVLNIIYKGTDGYTVLELDAGEPAIVVGSMQTVRAGERVCFFGGWRQHKQYGSQFYAETYESRLPTTAGDIALFLSGGFIKGLGEVLSDRIVERFGDRTFAVIQNDPLALSDVKGVSKKLAVSVREALAEYTGNKEAYARLMGMGLTAKQSMAAVEALGAGAQDIIAQNPYSLISAVRGIDFITADKIAAHMGLQGASPVRVENGVLHILRKSLVSGYTYVPETMLVQTAMSKLEVEEEAVRLSLLRLTLGRRIERKHYGSLYTVFLRSAYEAEEGSALLIRKIACAPVRVPVEDMDAKLLRCKSEFGLSDEQVSACRAAIIKNVCVITGGPGTGKTTILKTVLTILGQSGIDCVLAAPTGRAAKRMQETCGVPAQTIHRLLEYTYEEGADVQECVFRRNAENPLAAGAVIVDEVSMLDVFLLKSLLDALKTGTRLVLVGDKNQLPPVGAGNVMGDIIGSGSVPVCTLTRRYRNEGGIADAAWAILNGEEPPLSNDFVFLPCTSEAEVLSAVVELYAEYLGEGADVQVIAPVKKGGLGTRLLNEALREKVNPRAAFKREILFGESVFRKGDRVMQIKNNYARKWTSPDGRGEGVFNGDIGEVTDVREGALTVAFDDKLTDYETPDLMELETAYAYTIHKSQGSEFDVVILPLKYPEMPFFARNLLYTAVTRAKKKAVVVGDEHTLSYMIANERRGARFTALRFELENISRLFG